MNDRNIFRQMGVRIGVAILLVGFFSSSVLGQYIYTSRDNSSYTPGAWDDPATWTISNNQAWLPQTPGQPNSHGNFHGAEIYGFTIANGNLNLNGPNPVVNVRDTLYIDGNAIFGSGARLTVFPNGLLIINGNLTQEGNFTFDNNGTVVVTGDVLVTNGRLNNNSDFYVYGTTGVSNGGGLNNCFPWQSCNPESFTKTENNLINENFPLYEFVDSKSVNIILPVTLIHFKAQIQDYSILLSWATAEEENFDYFTIERSQNGIEFEEIGNVYSDGANTKERRDYEWTDTQPYPGISYYRLKATDYDGSVEYFKPAYVNFEYQGFSANIFPNPGSGQYLDIQLTTPYIKSVDFRLYNLSGALVYQTQINGFPANTINFDNALKKGVYLAIVSSGEESQSLKWVVK